MFSHVHPHDDHPRERQRSAARRRGVVLALLAALAPLPAAAVPCSQLAGLTTLDKNRCTSLERIDGYLPLGTATTPPALGLPVQPVLTGGSASQTEGDYYAKAMSIFGPLDYGAGDASRVAEANRVLRYAMFVGWPVSTANDIAYNPNVGANTKPWALDNRNVAMRTYWLFRNLLEADVRQEFERRLGFLRTTTLGSVSGSQNQKSIHYSAIVLAFRDFPDPASPIYQGADSAIRGILTGFARDGSVEVGSPYDYFTSGAVLNLAEWGSGSLGELARATLDYFLAEQLAFSLGVDFASPGIRRLPHWIFGYREPHTVAADVLFSNTAPANTSLVGVADFVASNYLPLVALRDQVNQQNALGSFEARADFSRFRHHFFRGANYGIGAQHAPSPSPFWAGSTNDALLVYVQAAQDQRASVSSYSYEPYRLKKQLGLNERSIGYKNVAMYQSGGRNVPSNGAGGAPYEYPVGMYLNSDYFVAEYNASTTGADSCWAFLHNTANNVYIGWALSRGAVVPGPVQSPPDNMLLQSTYVPSSTVCDLGQDGDPLCGEIAVFEVRDASEFGGNFGSFKLDLKARNSCSSLQPDGQQAVRYVAPDGTALRFGKGVLEVPGRPNFDTIPRFESPYLNNYTLAVGGRTVQFNFTAGTETGNLDRLGANITLGTFTLGPPAITTQPQSQTGLTGATLALGVQATGAGSYQWRRNGTPLADGGALSGTATPTLTIAGLSAAQVGSYTCVVSNVSGSVTSTAASVAVTSTIPALASETFSNASGPRDPGDPFTGNTTEIGGRTWTAHPTVVLGNGTLTTVLTATTHLAGFPFEPSQYASTPLATLEADVDPQGGEWVGIGFSQSAIGGYWTHGQVWMLLRASGIVNVFNSGTTQLLVSTTAPSFNPSGYNHLKLEVNFALNRVSAWVNGGAVLTDAALPVVPDVHFVGLHMHNGTASPPAPQRLDNFALNVGGSLPPSEVVVGVDRNVAGYLAVLQGSASATVGPAYALTTTANGSDGFWHVANDYIGLSGLNAIVSHGATEDSPRLTTTVSGLVSGGTYDLYGRFATASQAVVPDYWGIEMGPTAADLARYDQTFAYRTVLRNYGNWQEWEVYLGRVTAGGGTVSLLLDDDTPTRNVVWTGLRLAPPSGNAPVTLSFAPSDDAYTSEAQPSSNFGNQDFLRVHGGAGQGQYSWLKFDVSGLGGRVIRSRLKLRTQEAVIDETYAYRICSNAWSEATVTWANHPAASNCGYQTHRLALAANTQQSFDVTSYVDANGTYTLGLATSDPDLNLDFWSSEAATAGYRPVLEVVYQP